MTTNQNDLFARVFAGVLVGLYSVLFVAGVLIFLIAPPELPEAQGALIESSEFNELVLVMFAGGLGATVYSIRGYLIHACYSKDFSRTWIPWYFFRSLQGVLLSIAVYFAIRGGILVLATNGDASKPPALSLWGLAAIGSLVGLFSKYAIAKLRVVFEAAFTSGEDKDVEIQDTSKKDLV